MRTRHTAALRPSPQRKRRQHPLSSGGRPRLPSLRLPSPSRRPRPLLVLFDACASADNTPFAAIPRMHHAVHAALPGMSRNSLESDAGLRCAAKAGFMEKLASIKAAAASAAAPAARQKTPIFGIGRAPFGKARGKTKR